MKISRKTFHMLVRHIILKREWEHLVWQNILYQKPVPPRYLRITKRKRGKWGNDENYFQTKKHGIAGRSHYGLSFSITALQRITQWMRYSLATQTFPGRSGLWGAAIWFWGKKNKKHTQNPKIFLITFFWRRRKLKYTSVCIFCVH